MYIGVSVVTNYIACKWRLMKKLSKCCRVNNIGVIGYVYIEVYYRIAELVDTGMNYLYGLYDH